MVALIAPFICKLTISKVVMNLKIADIISGCIGLMLCAYVWVTSADFPKDVIMKIGPDFFPRLVVMAMAVACLALIAQALLSKSLEKAETLSFKDPGIQRALVVLVLAIAYVSCMDFLGFIISTVITMLIMMYLLKLRNPVQMLLVSIAAAFVINFAFAGLLGIQLPAGLLDGIINF